MHAMAMAMAIQPDVQAKQSGGNKLVDPQIEDGLVYRQKPFFDPLTGHGLGDDPQKLFFDPVQSAMLPMASKENSIRNIHRLNPVQFHEDDLSSIKSCLMCWYDWSMFGCEENTRDLNKHPQKECHYRELAEMG